MKKYTYYICMVSVLFIGCKKSEPEMHDAKIDSTQTVGKPESPTMVVPGEKIGKVALGTDATDLRFLGTPDLSDSAMGKSWATWYSANSKAVSGKHELNIYTEYKDGELKEKVVRLIRVTAPDFTVDGIGTGKTQDEIQAKFPDAQNAGDYAYGDTKDMVVLYDDAKNGIAFEILQSTERCIGVIVHPKDKNVTTAYRTFRPDMSIR